MAVSSKIRVIGLIYNEDVAAAKTLAGEIAAWLDARNKETCICARKDHTPSNLKADLLLILGGDGSILRAAHQVVGADPEVPLLGINLGRVGFLTETAPQNWQSTLERVLAGEGWIERRTMLNVTLNRKGASQNIPEDQALNDVVISRGAQARTVHLNLNIDNTYTAHYVADGLILATATGSTAYAYAAGGPILPPWLDNIVVAPIAPHLSLERPLVLDAQAQVEIKVTGGHPGVLTVDGYKEDVLQIGDRISIKRSKHKVCFLRLRNRKDFYNTLVARLTPRNSAEG